MDTRPADSELPTPRQKRRFARVVYTLAALAAVATLAALILIRPSSKLEWYVSAPIDKQGRRIRILVPAGWPSANKPNTQQGTWHKDPDGDATRVLINPTNRETSMVQAWLRKLHLVSPIVPSGVVIVQISQDVLLGWNRPQNPGLAVDGKLHEIQVGSGTQYIVRAVPLGNNGKQAAVICRFTPQQNQLARAAQICQSLRIE